MRGRFDIVERKNGADWQAYDVINKPFDLGPGSTVVFNRTYWRDFGETPEAFRVYVTAKAKGETLLVRNGNRDLITMANAEMEEAWVGMDAVIKHAEDVISHA